MLNCGSCSDNRNTPIDNWTALPDKKEFALAAHAAMFTFRTLHCPWHRSQKTDPADLRAQGCDILKETRIITSTKTQIKHLIQYQKNTKHQSWRILRAKLGLESGDYRQWLCYVGCINVTTTEFLMRRSTPINCTYNIITKKLSCCCDSRSYCVQYFNAIHCDRNISTSE